MEDDDKSVIAVVSLINESNGCDLWKIKSKKAIFLTRLGVARNQQGKGYASKC